MIEIVFNDSACGSLKMAQHYGKGEYQPGCMSVAIIHDDGSKPTEEEIKAAQREAEEKERLAWESAMPLGGNSADVYGFNLALSIGDISGDGLDIQRQRVIERLWSIYPNHEGEPLTQDLFQRGKQVLKAVCDLVKNGENLRIWYSNQPDEICGMYWFIAQLPQIEKHFRQISFVRLPEWEVCDDGIIAEKSAWGEVAPAEWHRYLSLEKTAPFAFFQKCAAQWRNLQQENAPLRAVLNGQLVSAPETLYDDFIVREITVAGEEFLEAMVIGRVLGKYRLGIGDARIALRIEEMIRLGKLKPVSEADKDSPIYHRLLKKCVKI